jgi:uncharacterized protein YndB with AHSA1/START domain
MLTILAVVILSAIFAIVVSARPDPALLRNSQVEQALGELGVGQTSWQTVVLLSIRDVDLAPKLVYRAWADPETWHRWGAPLIVNARWVDEAGWEPGRRFEATLDLGFPLSRLQRTETVGAVKPGERVSWWNKTSAVASNQAWSFQPLPGGGTRVTVVQIFQGGAVGLIRFAVQDRWQRRYDDALDGLILEARRAHS